MVIINIYLISTFNKYPQIRNGIGFCSFQKLNAAKMSDLKGETKTAILL